MLSDWRVGRRRQNLAGRSFWERSEQNFLNSLGNTDEKYLPYAVLKVQPSDGPVAQLVRASPCHGEGRRFESDLGRFWDLSSAGRASALQAEGHRFEPNSGSFAKRNMI